MASTLALILFIAAIVLFLIDATVSGLRYRLQSFGLACLSAAILLGGAALPIGS